MRIAQLETFSVPMTLENLQSCHWEHKLVLGNSNPVIVAKMLEYHLYWKDIDIIRHPTGQIAWLEEIHRMKIAFLFTLRAEKEIIAIMEDLVEDGHTFAPWTTARGLYKSFNDYFNAAINGIYGIGMLCFSSDTDSTLFRLRFKTKSTN